MADDRTPGDAEGERGVNEGYVKLHLPFGYGVVEVRGISITISLAALIIVAASAYQTSVIQAGLNQIVNQHEAMKDQTNELNSKLGLLVIQGILTEDQKANLPIIMQNEVKKIIAANAAIEASKAVEKGVPTP